jgi:ectoine hydroxylase-related dioxygenase (phytanoyl-CoA dioxygenase family)
MESMPDDLWREGIEGPYSLAASSSDLPAVVTHLLNDVLPVPANPGRWLPLAGLLLRRERGSARLHEVQWRERHFFMERHLDSSAVRNLCNDSRLRQQLSRHLGESLILWRSEIWVSRPSDCLIPNWHHDAYPRLLRGEGRNINVYLALSDVEEDNGFEYLPASLLSGRDIAAVWTDPFSGNQFFSVPPDLERRGVRVRMRAGEFVLFSDSLVHRSVRNTNGRTRMALSLRIASPSLQILRGYSPSYGPVAL